MPPIAVAMREPAQHVSPRARWMWAAGALVRGVIGASLLLLVSGPWDWFPMPTWAWVLYGVMAAGYVIAMPMLRYRTHRWETTAGAVYTQTGWLGRERRIAPLSRVQTVDVAQGVVSRLLGLATVTVTTASAKGPLRIAGLPRVVADEVVAELTSRSDDLAGDAT